MENLSYQFHRNVRLDSNFHNYGHGKNNLSINFIMIMFIAFLIDHIQLASCLKFQGAVKRFGTKARTWVEMVSIFKLVFFENWDHFFQCLLGERKLTVLFDSDSS